jgi:hypothetical protein
MDCNNPYPQTFIEGALSTRNCMMRWIKKGQVKEMTTGYNMGNSFGAFMAMYGCAEKSGYTMGFNGDAHMALRVDLLEFLGNTWGLAAAGGT